MNCIKKLLIEIKTSRKDSPDMMKRFMEKYGTVLKQNGHQMQSLDYHVIDQVLAYDTQIPVFLILPYNSIFPRTKATGYTMEYSTLDENFVTNFGIPIRNCTCGPSIVQSPLINLFIWVQTA